MKLRVFYSWQSDLPNNTNRGYIGNCIDKALKEIYRKNNNISEYVIDTDSRYETGTPDLVNNIFSKIDQCDIFIADITIINLDTRFRKTPNPNVLIELGYASSKIGWEKMLCIYNTEYGQIEDLPFDIRSRKPLVYSTKQTNNANLVFLIETQIQEIIDNHISNKKFYNTIKKKIDIGLQSILIDITKLLYFRETPKCYDYNLLLHMTKESIEKELGSRKILGFQLFKNQETDINEFVSFYNDQINIHFLNSKEKNLLARIILELKELKKILNNIDIYDELDRDEKYGLIDAYKMNKSNPENNFILVEILKDNKNLVLDSGEFSKDSLTKLLTYFMVKDNSVKHISNTIFNMINEINEWTRNTGGFFIFNERLLANNTNR